MQQLVDDGGLRLAGRVPHLTLRISRILVIIIIISIIIIIIICCGNSLRSVAVLRVRRVVSGPCVCHSQVD